MELFKEQFCRLCQNSITDVNFKVIDDVTKEILNVVLLKMNISDVDKHVMCTTCSEKLNSAFDFKSSCLYTNNVIVTYVDFENLVPVDLREIYMKENGIGELVDEEICRLCMQPVKKQFISVHEVDDDIFQRFVPEVKFNATKNPVICKLCVDTLTTHSSFIKKCSEMETNAKKEFAVDTIDSLTDLSHSDLCIKHDEINEVTDDVVKSEINSDDMEETSGELNKIEQIEIKSEFIEEERLHLPELLEISETRKRKAITVGNVPSTKKILNDELQEDLSFECDICDSKYKRKSDLNKHSRIHSRVFKIPKIQWFLCDLCDYKTKWKRSLTEHLLLHKEASEIQWYECDVCDYKGKTKRLLNNHMIKHKDASEIQWYECQACDYKSRLKTLLNVHMLVHKEASDLQLYGCDICDYKTKRKGNLKMHMLVHKDASEITWHKCDVCDGKYKDKGQLNRHMLIHKDPSEIQWYKCDVCDFKSREKRGLHKHMIVHKDASEVQWYECKVCDYKTRHKHSLNKHQLLHKDASEIQWHKCDVCTFKSKHKQSLMGHMRTHKDISEIPWHLCQFCGNKYKNKNSLSQHLLTRHEDESETQLIS